MTRPRPAYILVAGAMALFACSRTEPPDPLSDEFPPGEIVGGEGGLTASGGSPSGTGSVAGAGGVVGAGGIVGTGAVTGAGGAVGLGGTTAGSGGITGLCAPGDVLCADGCTDLLTDPRNCGLCTLQCGGACVNGRCVTGPPCPPCPSGTSCVNGQCVSGSTCSPSQTLCNGTCVDTSTDFFNCGACGNFCLGSCTGGECTPFCFPGQTVCEGRCVNLRRNAFNCGACGNVCPAMQLCRRGQCVP